MSPDIDEAAGNHRLALTEWADKPAVLIVDDEPQLVTALTDVLEEQYRVVGETSPKNALAILKEDPGIHVIISDQRMPLMTGDEFLFHARSVSSATRILVTAHADLGAVINAVNHGKIFNYVRKPWNEAELCNIVDAATQHFALGMALQQERALLKCIMDCSLDAISIKDARHRYVRLNGAEAAMLGAGAPAAARGKSHAEFLPAARAGYWTEEEDRLLETLEPLRNRIEHVLGEDGGDHWFAATKVPVKSLSGVPIGLVSVTRDVTEAKSLEQIKDDFISTARHELRTPFTIIVSTIKLIRSGRFGTLGPTIDDLLGRSEANCDRLLRLINNMLDLQDIMAGRVDLRMAPVALQDLISESCALNEPLAKASQINVVVSGVPPEASIVGSRERLIQVLCNLLSNACRFCPAHTSVTIEVSEQPDHVRISVIDQGPGVPSLSEDKLFKSFSQLDGSSTRSYDGAGLGLRVSKAIVEAHGGHLGFRPAPSLGSNFFLVLPRDPQQMLPRLSEKWAGNFDRALA